MTENLLISLKPVKLINSVNFTGKCRMLRKVHNITFFILSENQEMHGGGGGGTTFGHKRRYQSLKVIFSKLRWIPIGKYRITFTGSLLKRGGL